MRHLSRACTQVHPAHHVGGAGWLCAGQCVHVLDASHLPRHHHLQLPLGRGEPLRHQQSARQSMPSSRGTRPRVRQGFRPVMSQQPRQHASSCARAVHVRGAGPPAPVAQQPGPGQGGGRGRPGQPHRHRGTLLLPQSSAKLVLLLHPSVRVRVARSPLGLTHAAPASRVRLRRCRCACSCWGACCWPGSRSPRCPS